jgi:hypothetical protein
MPSQDADKKGVLGTQGTEKKGVRAPSPVR